MSTERERERDLDRVLVFVDAIVAIAITLLVLPLVDLASTVDKYGSVATMLRKNFDLLWSFALSFVVIARLWMSQHGTLGPLLQGSQRVMTLLMCWAFTIVFIPFPTSLIADSGDSAIVKSLYLGTIALSIVILTLIRVEIRRHPERSDDRPYSGPLAGLVTVGLLAVALAATLVFPALGYYPVLLLTLDGFVVHQLRRL